MNTSVFKPTISIRRLKTTLEECIEVSGVGKWTSGCVEDWKNSPICGKMSQNSCWANKWQNIFILYMMLTQRSLVCKCLLKSKTVVYILFKRVWSDQETRSRNERCEATSSEAARGYFGAKWCLVIVRKNNPGILKYLAWYLHQSLIWKSKTSPSNHFWSLKIPTTNHALKQLI